MKVLFLGGDKRQIEIINHLNDKGHKVDVIGYELATLNDNINKLMLDDININEYEIIIFPVSGVKENYYISSEFGDDKIVLNSEFLVGVRDKTLIFTGVMTKDLKVMLDNAKRDAVVLMDDNEVKNANSIPTVEGIISDLIDNTDYTIDGSNIFILGYGNVGKTLTQKLKSLGAEITVGVLLFEDYKQLTNDGINCIYTNNQLLMEKIICNTDIIVNTVPNIILNKKYLEATNKNAYLLDIASHPHGIDFNSANELHIKNKLLLGIPGKVAPKTAGLILVRKIESILERSQQ